MDLTSQTPTRVKMRWPTLGTDERQALATMEFTVPQAAERLGCSTTAVWHYIKTGRVLAHRLGRRGEYQIHAVDLLNFLDRRFPEYAPPGVEPRELDTGSVWSLLRPHERAWKLLHLVSPRDVARACNWPRLDHVWQAVMRGDLIGRKVTGRGKKYGFIEADLIHFLGRCRDTLAGTGHPEKRRRTSFRRKKPSPRHPK
jgi:hypothetical protein